VQVRDKILYNFNEVGFMKTNGNKPNSNGKLPTAKDFPPPKKLTPEMIGLRDATREAMQALRDRIEKYGKPTDFRH
jgi:hypothetical protein